MNKINVFLRDDAYSRLMDIGKALQKSSQICSLQNYTIQLKCTAKKRVNILEFITFDYRI